MEVTNKTLAAFIDTLRKAYPHTVALDYAIKYLSEVLDAGGPDALHERIKNLEQCFDSAFKINQKFCQQLTGVEAAKKLVEDELKSLEKSYDELKLKADYYQRGEANMCTAYEKRRKEIEQLKHDNDALAKANQELRDKQLADFVAVRPTSAIGDEAKLARLNRTLDDRDRLIDALRADHSTVCQAHDALCEEVLSGRDKQAKHVDAHNAALKRIDQLQNQLNAANANINELNKQCSDARELREKAEYKLEDVKARLAGYEFSCSNATEISKQRDAARADNKLYKATTLRLCAEKDKLASQLNVEKEESARWKDQFLSAETSIAFWKRKQNDTFDQLQDTFAKLKELNSARAIAEAPFLDNEARKYFAKLAGTDEKIRLTRKQYISFVRLIGFTQAEVSDAQAPLYGFSNSLAATWTEAHV